MKCDFTLIKALKVIFGAFSLCLTFHSISALASETSQSNALTDYVLGVGDAVRVDVYRESDLSVTLKINEGGDISFPLIGTLSASGLTIAELGERITSMLADGYLISPRVSVKIEEYRQYFIYGEVNSPGAYNYQPGLNVRKAVVLAGGFTDRASSSKFYVIGEGETDPDKKNKVNLTSMIKPGDILTIEQSFF